MTQCRVLALAFLVLPLAACGGKSPAVEDVRPRTIVLDWVEFARSDGTPVLELRVRRVHLSGSGWRVWASVRNVSRVSFTLKRPGGVAGTLGRGRNWTWFGLTELSAPGVGTRISHAEKYSPPLPRVLAPKRTWSGVFAGPAFSTTDRTIGVTFGFFVPERRLPGLPESFGWLTDHSFRT